MSAGVHVHFDPLSEVSRRVCLWSDVVFGVTSPPSRGSGDFRPEKTRRASFGSYPTLYQSMSSPLTITLHCHSGQPFGSFVVRVSQSEPGRSNSSFFVVARNCPPSQLMFPGHYAISSIQHKGMDHMLILPSYAGPDSTAPGCTRYRLGTYSRDLFNTVPKLIAFYIDHECVRSPHCW